MNEELMKKHGTMDEFIAAVMNAVPSMISIEEARNAIDKYREELLKTNDTTSHTFIH
jgi:hypothetical protein